MIKRNLAAFALSAVGLCCWAVQGPSAQPKTSKSQSGTTAESTPNAKTPSSWKQVPIPALHQFKPQEPKRIELPNGMVIFLQEDHELPLIDGTIRIRGGSRDEPGEKAGLAEIYSSTWRTGGTKTKTGDELDDFLESRAARVETSHGGDSTFLSFSALKENFDQVFPVVMDVLENPEFREEKIKLTKNQLASLIVRRNDDVDEIAQRESTRLAYGPDNPYGRIPELYTIDAVTRQDLIDWHQRTVGPRNIVMGVAGDFDPALMEAKLRQAFGSLPPGQPVSPTKVEFHPPKPGTYFVEKNDVNQSEINLVDLGTDRHNPDFYAISVMNEVFGGGFSSRLFSRIRTKMGLAYSVGGGVGTAFDHPGITHIAMGTKSGTTAQGIEALRHEIDLLVKGGVTQKELKSAKDAILNSFIFEFDSKEKVLAERMRYEFYGYPPDFLERFRAGIEKVTPQDVDRVARKYVHPQQMAILVVGNSKDFDRDLATFGKVTSIDITIPQKKGGM